MVVHVHEVSITPGPLRRFLTGCAGRSADLLLYVSVTTGPSTDRWAASADRAEPGQPGAGGARG